MIRRSRLLAPAALTTALLLSACGGGGTSDGGTASASPKPGLATLSQSAFFSTTGQTTTASKGVHVSGSAGSGSQRFTMDGDVRGAKTLKDSEFALTVNVESQKIELRLIDRKLYLSGGEASGNKFFVLDPEDTSNPLTRQFSTFYSSVDPAQQLQKLRSAVVSFKASDATTRIGGVETREYTAVVDTEKSVKAAGFDVPDGALAKLPKTFPVKAWVDADNRPRRIVTEVVGQKFTLDFTKWGEPVTIEKPAASEISKQNPFAKAA